MAGSRTQTTDPDSTLDAPYRLVRRLDAGTRGEVFEAEHTETGKRVAVKRLHPHAFGYQWRATAFLEEARASARIGSPHIVAVVDSLELPDGRPMIAMELLDGITLRALMDQGQGPVAPMRALRIAQQIAKGLRAAHEAGLLHLGLGPEQVMLVEREGQQDFVVLLGLGGAQLLPPLDTRRSGAVRRMTLPGGGHEHDARADVQALGALLYELVCGVPALDPDEPTDPPVAPSRRVRGLSRRFDAVVMRCLQREATARFPTMADLEVALGKAAQTMSEEHSEGGPVLPSFLRAIIPAATSLWTAWSAWSWS